MSRAAVHHHITNACISSHSNCADSQLTTEAEAVGICLGVEELAAVLFTDETVFELMHHSNRRNERVSAHRSAEVPATMKQPVKVVV